MHTLPLILDRVTSWSKVGIGEGASRFSEDSRRGLLEVDLLSRRGLVLAWTRHISVLGHIRPAILTNNSAVFQLHCAVVGLVIARSW